jgi:hypothetical protein
MQWCDTNDLTADPLPGTPGARGTDTDGSEATWCVYEVNVSNPDGTSVTAAFSVYGEDDPHWR